MLEAFINIRFKQLIRAIIEIGFFRMIFLIGLIAFLGITIFIQTSKPPNSFYVAGITTAFIVFIHSKRQDKLFLKTHFNDFRLMLFVEYLLLSSPIIAFLIWHHQWIPAVVLLLAPRLIVFIDVKPSYRNLNTKLQKLIPNTCFEWKAGIRKTFYATVILWFAALGTSFYIGSVPIAIFVLGIIFLSFYENGEPLQMLIAFEKSANQFLLQKIELQLFLFSVLILPLILAFIIFHPENWYIPIAEYFIFTSVNIYTVLTKYAFYTPNSKSPAGQTFAAIGAVCGIIPFLLPVVWLLSLRFYFKSVENLNTYLNDYN